MQNSENIYFTPYRVSTITCNADIGKNISIDLALLFQHIKISCEDRSFIWIQYLKDDGENCRGIYPKRKRKSKTVSAKKCRFDNQITVIFKFNAEYMPNVKIFKNGNIQLTGIKDIRDPMIIGNEIIQNIINIYTSIDQKLFTTDQSNPLEMLQYHNFKIRMINTDFKIFEDSTCVSRYNIKRKELHNILIGEKYNNKSSFQPGIYQGVKLEYFWNSSHSIKKGLCTCSKNCFGKNSGHGDGNCKKVTIAIFEIEK